MSVKYEERTVLKNGKSFTIGIATLENKPVNALSTGVRAGLAKISSKVKSFPVNALIICGSGSQFCAGADIAEFSEESAATITHPLTEVIQSIEDLEVPVVAAIHGFAFGGGLELALGCHYRVATDNANVGLPEVKLGIIPGAGGTQRLPRLIGVQNAIEYITSGNPISAKKAKALNLVDHLVKIQQGKSALESVVEGAIEFIVSNNLTVRKTSSKSIEQLDPEFWKTARAAVQKKARGYLAPLHCFDAIQGCTLPFAEGIARETEIITRVIRSPQAVAQQYLFFAERKASKNKYTTGTPSDVNSVGIIGAGTMGAGIAINFLSAGIKTILLEKEQKFLDAGVERIVSTYNSYVKRGTLTQAKVDQILSLLKPTTNMNDFASADLVIEAVFEDMNLKKEIFSQLDSICPPSTLLCTNTSTLDVDEIASSTKRPDKVIGTHFFSPANIMKLLEIVRGKHTSLDTIATVFKLGQRIKKVCVVVGNCDGFVGNRMLEGYGQEANFLIEEGATPEQVDRVLASFGMAMGPFTMYDVAGGDVGYRIRKGKAATRDPNERYPGIADRLCELGRYGQKTGKGWYLYRKEDPRKPVSDPEISTFIENYSKEIGITRRNIPDDEIFWRCMLPLINEGFKILEEGIANSASDIDVIWIYGYGWPPYTGGPMHFAETTGLDKILTMLQSYSEKHPNIPHFKPANLLQKMVKDIVYKQTSKL